MSRKRGRHRHSSGKKARVSSPMAASDIGTIAPRGRPLIIASGMDSSPVVSHLRPCYTESLGIVAMALVVGYVARRTRQKIGIDAIPYQGVDELGAGRGPEG